MNWGKPNEELCRVNIFSRSTMRIFVGAMKGVNIELVISSSTIVLEIKHKVKDKMNIPIESQTLIFHGTELSDFLNAQECGIYPDSILILVQKTNMTNFNFG